MSILGIKVSIRNHHKISCVILMQANSLKYSEFHRLVSFLKDLFGIILKKRDATLKILNFLTQINDEVRVVLREFRTLNVDVLV